MPNSNPIVSIIIPAYNCASLISYTLDSVFTQTFTNFEVIVIDDGSIDDTPVVLKNYPQKIHVISQKNQGVAEARNSGLRVARGKYIAFLDADDIWFNYKLQYQVDYLDEHEDVGMVYGNWQCHETQEQIDAALNQEKHLAFCGSAIPLLSEDSGWIYTRLLLDCVVHTITTMFRRELLEEIGYFDSSFYIGEDYDFWFRASRVSRIDKLDLDLSIYRLHDDSLTMSSPKTINWEGRVIDRALSTWGIKGPQGELVNLVALKQRLFKLNFNFGYSHYYSGELGLARGAFLSAIKYKPTNIKAWYYFFSSIIKGVVLIVLPSRST